MIGKLWVTSVSVILLTLLVGRDILLLCFWASVCHAMPKASFISLLGMDGMGLVGLGEIIRYCYHSSFSTAAVVVFCFFSVSIEGGRVQGGLSCPYPSSRCPFDAYAYACNATLTVA